MMQYDHRTMREQVVVMRINMLPELSIHVAKAAKEMFRLLSNYFRFVATSIFEILCTILRNEECGVEVLRLIG